VSRVREQGNESFARVSIPQLGPATVSGTPSGAAGYTPSAPSHGGFTPSAPSMSQHSGVVPSPSHPALPDDPPIQTPSQDELSIETEPRIAGRSGPPELSAPPHGMSSQSPALGGRTVPSLVSSAPRRSTATWWMLAVGGALALTVGALGGAAALWSTDEAQLEPPGATSVAEPPAVDLSTTVQPTASASTAEQGQGEQIRVAVRASPRAAEIHIDGRKVGDNPYQGRFDRDGQEHEIRVAAKGYVPVRRTVLFDQDVELDLKLRLARAGRIVSSPPTSEAEPLPTAPQEDEDWMKKQWPKSTRPIDEDNPYAK